MTQYERITGKVFGGNATATGNDPQIAQFGSALANTFVGTTDPETIQSLPAWGQGWIGAVTPETQFPPLPEMTGAMKVLSHQICGILQQGVSTWDNGTIYYTGNFVSLNGKLYISQVDENQGNNPETDTTNWKEFSSGGSGFEVGDIGIAPLGLDETQNKRRYLNGQLIIQEQFVGFTEKLKSAVTLYPTLACTEEEWQTIATMSVGGQVGKFVVDNNAGTIRLPRIIMPIQGLTDLSSLAEIVKAGSPNITGSFFMGKAGNVNNGQGHEGAFNRVTEDGAGSSAAVSGKTYRFHFDASASSSVYGNSNTVQQEQIQYPYFIQVATGASESIDTTRATEINNPFFFGQSEYFEVQPNNTSWIKSTGTYLSKAVYPDYYDWLLRIFNGTETQEGVSVKSYDDTTLTDYDFGINTTDETFRLPLLNGSETIPDFDINKRVSKDKASAESPNIAENNCYVCFSGASTESYGTGARLYIEQGDGTFIQTLGCNGASMPNLTSSGIAFVPAGRKYYIITANFTYCYEYPCIGNGSLYYYVGEGIVNPQLVNVARIEEKIVDLIPDNNTVWDGQWFETALTVVSSATIGSNADLEYDVSSLLPDDSYDYLVFVNTEQKSTANAGFWVQGKYLSTVNRAQTTNSISSAQGYTVIGADRKVKITSGSVSVTNATVQFAWARRLGTNQ